MSQDMRSCILNDIVYLQLTCSIGSVDYFDPSCPISTTDPPSTDHLLAWFPVHANQSLPYLRHCVSHFSFPSLIMLSCWVSYALTFSQAIYLAGALPRPQAHGLYGPESDSPCANTGSDSPEVFAMNPASSANTLSARQTASGSSSYTDSNVSTYTSAITIIQPDRRPTVATSTDLSSTQVPTTTSASQSSPDTTGVRRRIHGQ